MAREPHQRQLWVQKGPIGTLKMRRGSRVVFCISQWQHGVAEEVGSSSAWRAGARPLPVALSENLN